MIKNSQMKANRYLTWHKARRTVAAIVSHLEMGHAVIISTYTRHTKYTKKHIDMFKAAKNGVFVQSGKNWNCIDGTKITVWR
jgi:hypothetical protein